MRNNARMINEKVGKKRCKVQTFRFQRVDQHVGILTPKCQRLVHGVANQERQSDHIYKYAFQADGFKPWVFSFNLP
jgi:hypothetical protein